jgi:hypothetical protein
MGTKYSSNAASGFDATPPSDDGTVSEANKVKWSTIKTKLATPVKDLADAINTDLVTHFDVGPTALTSNTTLGATHYNQIIQVSGAAVTLTLSDAATLGAGWYCKIISTDSSNATTIGRATGADTINGSAANFTLPALHSVFVEVNAAANGFLVRSAVINPVTTDTAQTISGAKTFQSTDAGATVGPEVILDRFSASPAANDEIGSLVFRGRDSAANSTDYANVSADITDPTNASEDARLLFRTLTGGVNATRAYIGGGVVVGSATGGDQGTGTVNVELDIYKNSVAYANLGAANVFTATQTIRSSDDGASGGPELHLDRLSASPAANDEIGAVSFDGRDSIGAPTAYAVIAADITDPTNGSEDGRLLFRTLAAGANGTRMVLGNGLLLGSPTGGDKGSGTLNVATEVYKNNSAYANPDYVFEHYYTGQIEKFKDNEGAKEYTGLPSLEEVAAHVKENYKLPGFTNEPAGMFKRSDLVLEKIEQLFLYVFEIKAELETLKQKNRARPRNRRS